MIMMMMIIKVQLCHKSLHGQMLTKTQQHLFCAASAVPGRYILSESYITNYFHTTLLSLS